MTTPVSTKIKASQNAKSSQEDNLQTNISLTPIITVTDETDDQSLKGEEDLVSEVNQIIHMALAKKGYKKRLEKLEGRIRELHLMEKELEILKRQQDLADFTAIRSQITDIATAQDEQTTTLATALTRAIKEELLPSMKEEFLTTMREVITTEVQKQLHKQTTEEGEDFPTLQQSYARN